MELGTVGPENRLDDPKNINDAGWYRDSAKPGQATPQNPAGLYDGHNTGTDQKGIFYALGNLVAGDAITIERGDGVKLNYAVREVSTVRLEEIDMSVMMQSVMHDVEGLNIITCGGAWSADRQTYTHRVTVRATLVE
jgi:sortase (surface protein transpeptidase)